MDCEDVGIVIPPKTFKKKNNKKVIQAPYLMASWKSSVSEESEK